MDQNVGEGLKEYVRADLVNRFLAKFIDFLLVGALAQILKPIGPLSGLTYILISDGLFQGRSIGKKIIGLRVIVRREGRECNYRDSIVRNLTLAAVVLFSILPLIGWFLFFTVGIIILIFESYLIITDEAGIRIGDILADTQVIDSPRK
ncbi:MAG: RDD family protein [Deltaproteobacteria bacterium]|nr:MAG: RDD family protein [Deltaproteobacteria bacterium]